MTWNNDARHRARFDWTPERSRKLVAMRAHGTNYAECARQIGGGCTESIVKHRVKKLNLVEPREGPGPWTLERVQKLCEMWAAGYSALTIGRMIGMGKNAVIGKVHRLGLKKRPSPIVRRASPIPVTKEPKIAATVVEMQPAAEPARVVRHLIPRPEKRCEWPNEFHPGDARFGFDCKAVPLTGRSYCAAHAAKAYRRVEGAAE